MFLNTKLYYTNLQMALKHCSVCHSLQHMKHRIGRDHCTHDTQRETSIVCQWKRNIDMYLYFCYVVCLIRQSIVLDYIASDGGMISELEII